MRKSWTLSSTSHYYTNDRLSSLVVVSGTQMILNTSIMLRLRMNTRTEWIISLSHLARILTAAELIIRRRVAKLTRARGHAER